MNVSLHGFNKNLYNLMFLFIKSSTSKHAILTTTLNVYLNFKEMLL